MDLSAAIAGINYSAAALAALASFVIGGLWYSPLLFQRAWMESAGMTQAQLQSGKLSLIFGVSFLLQLIAAFVLAMFLGPAANFQFGITAGFMVGAAWVATAFGVVYLFERRRLRLFWINAGYQVIVFMTMGAILGTWR